MFTVAPDCDGWSGLGRVVQAAWDAIDTDRPAEVTMRAIAKRAGVSHTLLSYYFTCRSELYEFVGAAAVQALQAHLKGADAVEAVAARWFEFATARPRHYVAMPRIAFQRE